MKQLNELKDIPDNDRKSWFMTIPPIEEINRVTEIIM